MVKGLMAYLMVDRCAVMVDRWTFLISFGYNGPWWYKSLHTTGCNFGVMSCGVNKDVEQEGVKPVEAIFRVKSFYCHEWFLECYVGVIGQLRKTSLVLVLGRFARDTYLVVFCIAPPSSLVLFAYALKLGLGTRVMSNEEGRGEANVMSMVLLSMFLVVLSHHQDLQFNRLESLGELWGSRKI
jgi:hypothetical protein